MFKFFKRPQESASTDLEEMRKRNNEAIQELLEKNQRLEKKRDFRNPKKVMKAELELSKECERRIMKLNLEAEKWNAKEEKLMCLDRRRNELFRTLERTNEQLIEKPVLKSYLSGAKEQQKSLKRLNTRLENHVNILTEQLSYQTKVFDKYTKSADSNKKLMRIQESCITDIMDKLKIFNLAALHDKNMAKDENLDQLDKRNNSLLQKLESLKQQLVDVPIMRYHYRCAKKECQRLTQLNPKLEKLVRDLSDELSCQTALERDYKEAADMIEELEATKQNYLYKIEDLKSTMKLGIKSKKRDNIAKRLSSLKLKLNDLKKEFVSCQLDIENILGNIQSINAVITKDKICPAEDQTFTIVCSNLTGDLKQVSVDPVLSEGECVPPTRESQEQTDFSESKDEASDKELEDSSLEETTTEDDLSGLNNTTVKESDPEDHQRLRENEKQDDVSESENETSDEESEDSSSEDTMSEEDLTESYSTARNESFPQDIQMERESEKEEKLSESEDETSDEEFEDTTSEDDSTDLCDTPVKDSDTQDLQGRRGNKTQDFSESVDKASDKELEDRTMENTTSEDDLTESYSTARNESFPQDIQRQRESEKQEKLSESEDETSDEEFEDSTSEDDSTDLCNTPVKDSDTQDLQGLRGNKTQDFSESVDKASYKELEDRTMENTSEDDLTESWNATVKNSDPQNLQGQRENEKQLGFSESVDKMCEKEFEDRTLENTTSQDNSHNPTVTESNLPDRHGLRGNGKQEDFSESQDKMCNKEIKYRTLENTTSEDNLNSYNTTVKKSECPDLSTLRGNEKQEDFSESVDKIHDKELEDRTLEETRYEDDLTDSHNTTVKESDSSDLQRLEMKGKQEDFAKSEDKTSDKELKESPLEDMMSEDNLTDSLTSLKESD
ncbi:myb-like protein X [Gambusia affinis]|uniref:myb-like protein X n=1 Tax=Gambusia affinis TaxID=33528 RepID=UPI001CDD04BA|nr:myb-like protein X [Gambusia affinis]